MSGALILTAFLLGLGGAPHCTAMCGASCTALTTAPQAATAWRATWVFHLARALSYAAAGALLAWATGALPALLRVAPVLRPAWTLLHVAVLALGLGLLIAGRLPTWLARFGMPAVASRLQASIQPVKVVPRRTAARALAGGALWAGWPCGLLQSAFLVAALASSPVGGAAVMLAFAAGSAPGLWLAPWFWQRYGRHRAGEINHWAMRLTGLGLVSGAGFALWHGLWTEASAVC